MTNAPVEPWRERRLDVELRCFALAERLTDPDLAVLSDAERTRASSFGSQRRRIEYVSARAHLRRALADVLGIEPASIPITPDNFGKPQHAGGLQFNLAHSAGAVLIGWGPRPLGVDLEAADRSARHIGRLEIVASVIEAMSMNPVAAFTLVEAATKALGRGVAVLRALRLSRVRTHEEAWFATAGGQSIHATSVPAPQGYVGAVAILD